MKKHIFIIFLSFTSLLGTSKTSNDTLVSNIKESVLEAIPDSSVLTFKEVYSDIKSGLTALGSSLKVGSEHVYEVLVKQQLVNSFTYLGVVIITILSLISFLKVVKTAKYGSNIYYDSDDEKSRYWVGNRWNLNGTLSIIFGVSSFIGILLTLATFNNMIMGFINPEYGAIKEILEVIK